MPKEPIVVGPYETLSALLCKSEQRLEEVTLQRDVARAEVQRLRRLMQRMLGRFENQVVVSSVEKAIADHEEG